MVSSTMASRRCSCVNSGPESEEELDEDSEEGADPSGLRDCFRFGGGGADSGSPLAAAGSGTKVEAPGIGGGAEAIGNAAGTTGSSVSDHGDGDGIGVAQPPTKSPTIL